MTGRIADALPVDDDITDELLESLPEIGGPVATGASPFSALKRAPPNEASAVVVAAPPPTLIEVPAPIAAAPAPAPADAGSDAAKILSQVRQQMEASFAEHLNRIETSFGGLLKDMEYRLSQANAELSAVRQENERVKMETERKTETLRELKRTLEKF